jgi:hypothetical protein
MKSSVKAVLAVDVGSVKILATVADFGCGKR